MTQEKELQFLSKAAILAQDDLVQERLDIPEWGGFVFVRSMTAEERDDFETDLTIQKGDEEKVNMANFRTRLAVRTVCNEKGKKMFTANDIPALAAKSAIPLSKIYTVACRLNGIGKQEVEGLVKN